MTRTLEQLKTLKAEIIADLEHVEHLDQKLASLAPEQLGRATSEEELILIGYFLSGIYSTFEDIFKKVARVFENKIEDVTRWHAELLRRMTLEVEQVRPALISQASFSSLDELRGFRNVFRYSYAYELDGEKMAIAFRRWQAGKKRVLEDIQAFLNALDKLAEEDR